MKKKTILGFILFIAFMGIAYFAYNNLSKNYKPDNQILPQSTITPTQAAPQDTAKNNDAETENNDQKIEAPDFTVYDKDGNAVKLSDFEGKPVVLNFWASWCSPCKSEMPHFEKIYKEMGDEVHFVMVNMTDGQRETQKKAEKYIDDEGFSFPVYLDLDEDAAYTYGISSIPTTVFIDKDGYAITGIMGGIDEEYLLDKIELIR